MTHAAFTHRTAVLAAILPLSLVLTGCLRPEPAPMSLAPGEQAADFFPAVLQTCGSVKWTLTLLDASKKDITSQYTYTYTKDNVEVQAPDALATLTIRASGYFSINPKVASTTAVMARSLFTCTANGQTDLEEIPLFDGSSFAMTIKTWQSTTWQP